MLIFDYLIGEEVLNGVGSLQYKKILVFSRRDPIWSKTFPYVGLKFYDQIISTHVGETERQY